MRFLSLPTATTTAALVCALSACSQSTSTGPSIESTTFAAALGVDLKAMTKTPDGLYVRDVTVGTGALAIVGHRVSVHYTGWLANGTQFDANGPSDPPFSFNIGVGEVIAGWDEGVQGMLVGGRRQLVIPPSLAYGAAGAGGGVIPPNAILVFVIDLVAVQ